MGIARRSPRTPRSSPTVTAIPGSRRPSGFGISISTGNLRVSESDAAPTRSTDPRKVSPGLAATRASTARPGDKATTWRSESPSVARAAERSTTSPNSWPSRTNSPFSTSKRGNTPAKGATMVFFSRSSSAWRSSARLWRSAAAATFSALRASSRSASLATPCWARARLRARLDRARASSLSRRARTARARSMATSAWRGSMRSNS